MASKYYYNLSGATRRRAYRSGVDGIFAWTIFIFLLIGFTLFCWMGSFYIFGHPEKASNYRLLKRLHKIEEPQRFEITSAPRGEFLKPGQLLERFARLTPQEIMRTNAGLLRNFLRNYHQTHDLVPYAVGTYKVLAAFPLTEKNFVSSGMVALLQAEEQPEILLEQVFPTASNNIPALEAALQTGQEIKLDKPLDLSAIIFIDRLSDGRIKLTTMPLLYGSYAIKEGLGSFHLEPPCDLNLTPGLPLVTRQEIATADQKYSESHNKFSFSPPAKPTLNGAVAQKKISTPLVLIVSPTPIAPNALKNSEPISSGKNLPKNSDMPVSRALPVNVQPVLPAVPITPLSNNVAPAGIPTATPATALAVAKPTSTPHQLPPAAPTPPAAPAATNPIIGAPMVNTTGGLWPVYDQGKMPRGRLIDVSEIPALADRGVEGERLYLQGNFAVTASGQDRAVLRYETAMSGLPIGRTGKIRIIVAYPAGATPPAEGTSLVRNHERPFMITETKKGADGTINLYVREITKP